MTPDRDARDEDAFQLDRYLDDLLSGEHRPLAIEDVPATGIDPELVQAARVVNLALSRFHPSFRFEDHLAGRLRTAAESGLAVASRTPTGVVIPFVPATPETRSRSRRVNSALLGGAISAGVSLASIAGAALMARRRGRTDGRWERVV
jgi:hypothetical protein